MNDATPTITAIAARVGPGYGLGPKVARSLVSMVLAVAAKLSPTSTAERDLAAVLSWMNGSDSGGMSCPPEHLRSPCRDDCASCYREALDNLNTTKSQCQQAQ